MEIEARYEFKSEEDAEGRLDSYLARVVPEHSRSFFTRLIKDGLVRVDEVEVKPSFKIRPGRYVEVTVPRPRVPEIIPEEIPLHVLYEDDDLAVVNKQAGLVVHPAYGHERGTLVNALLFHFSRLSSLNGDERPGIVHRLDKDTTGIILVAKNDRTHAVLADQFKERTIHKEYLAITVGEFSRAEGVVDAPIGRSLSDRKKMAVRHDVGREAVTKFRVKESFNGFTLVKCFPETGRTHQIRLHMKSLNHPVLCDSDYSRRRKLYLSELEGVKRRPEESPLLERQALHAVRIEFSHPDGRLMTFEQEPPEDMRGTLSALREYRKV